MQCAKMALAVLALYAAALMGFGPRVALAREHGHEKKHDEHGKEKEHDEHGEAEGHGHKKAEAHGGQVTMTKEFHFEVLFHRDEVRVYLYDIKQNPLSMHGIAGTVSFRTRTGRKPAAQLRYVAPHGGDHDEGGHHEAKKAVGYLSARAHLASAHPGGLKATFHLRNLPGKHEKELSFIETFQGVVEFACGMKGHPVQKTPGKCPKCGMKLVKVGTLKEAHEGAGHGQEKPDHH